MLGCTSSFKKVGFMPICLRVAIACSTLTTLTRGAFMVTKPFSLTCMLCQAPKVKTPSSPHTFTMALLTVFLPLPNSLDNEWSVDANKHLIVAGLANVRR